MKILPPTSENTEKYKILMKILKRMKIWKYENTDENKYRLQIEPVCVMYFVGCVLPQSSWNLHLRKQLPKIKITGNPVNIHCKLWLHSFKKIYLLKRINLKIYIRDTFGFQNGRVQPNGTGARQKSIMDEWKNNMRKSWRRPTILGANLNILLFLVPLAMN